MKQNHKKRNRLNSISRFNKKGNVFTDVILVVVVLLGMAIVGVIANNMFDELNNDIQADDDINNSTKVMSDNLKTRFPLFMDGGFLFAFVLLWLFVIVSSIFIDSHPVFFIVSLLLLLFGYGIIMMMGNAYEELILDDDFSSISVDFPYTHFIMSNLLSLSIAMGSSVLISLYAKNKFYS